VIGADVTSYVLAHVAVPMPSHILAEIPSPSSGEWQLGPFPLRAYALAILLGIFVAVWLANRRWMERGGESGQIIDIAMWAVPFGIAGGRIYHVISSPAGYFGEGGDPLKAFAIWEGGLGIWGAIAFGGVGVAIGARRMGIRFSVLADVIAPSLLVAQAIGRLGNWFNQELFGGPTDLPWGLRIDPTHPNFPSGFPADTLFHPTFLYELLWNLAAAALIIFWAERRFKLGHGRVFLLYVMLYTAGRLWIEMLRIDPAEHIFGVRLNVWTSILVGGGALVWFIISNQRQPGREESIWIPGREPEVAEEAASETDN